MNPIARYIDSFQRRERTRVVSAAVAAAVVAASIGAVTARSTTVAACPSTGKTVCSMLHDAPTSVDEASTDGRPTQLGVHFTANADGVILGVRFYKGAGNTGTDSTPHEVSLWREDGKNLATVFLPPAAEPDHGWVDAHFTEPVPISANVGYIAAYFAPNGHYADTPGGLAATQTGENVSTLGGSVIRHADLTAFGVSKLKDFPGLLTGTDNYWVDVDFQAAPKTAPPLAAILPPTPPVSACPNNPARLCPIP